MKNKSIFGRIFSGVAASAVLLAGAAGFPEAKPADVHAVSVSGAVSLAAPFGDSGDYLFCDQFEGSENSWSGRGAASVEAVSGMLSVTGRTATWNGAYKSLSSTVFVPGTAYSFSANVMYETGPAQQTFQLTLQYTAGGETYYSNIATAAAEKGVWVQLANTNYEIPAGASDLQLYVETDETDTDNIDFYVDEAIGAAAGTVIGGTEPDEPVILGDVNLDGAVNSLDMITARKIIISGEFSGLQYKALDVDSNGKLEVADLVLIQSFILGRAVKWPDPPVTTTTTTTTTQPPVTTTVTTEPPADNKWDDYNETASAQWIGFYKDSIYNMGNTYRLSKKLTAAENGESLTMAYLGGSITEGKNYSSPFSDYVKNTFAKGSFKEVNAGMSGTSSVVGLVRSEKDIVSHNPDIIFLEFSVNDHEDIMYKKCFESVIKKFLSLPNEPAVIILINRAQGGFSSQQQMAAVGKNFDIPVISMDNALTKAFNSGFLKTSDYFQDEYHPHASGGKLISDCLGYYFRQAMRSENRSASYTIPTSTVYGTEYETCVNMSANELQNFNAGSFTAGMGYGSLPYSYTHQKGGNTPMTFKTTGKGLIIVFKANSSGMGNINVTVNGKTTKVSGNKLYTWGGPDAELGYYQDTAGELDVSISMENPGSDFTIWGLGVIK